MDNDELAKSMNEAIKKNGGVFCQYRPCKRDVSTIYDIENIKNGVVYAQTPLNMNDPFDSFLGYSSKDIYDEIINLIVDAFEFDEEIKFIVFNILKFKYWNKLADLILDFKNIKDYYLKKHSKFNNVNDNSYIIKNLSKLYSGRPKDLNIKLSKSEFAIILALVLKLDDSSLSEDGILRLYKLDSILKDLFNIIDNTKDIFLEKMKEFLSKITVSCFTNSGWNNQLMWSHYANSYCGICIEYDFNKLNDFQGFIYPVNYNKKRPLFSLSDMGIEAFDLNNKKIKSATEIDINLIIRKMLYKNDCWNYEKEWRIINIGDPYVPKFLNIPFIKSITFGQKIDPICKEFLYDVCCKKKIDCYDLVVLPDSYTLDRKKITKVNMPFNLDLECEYISILISQISNKSNKMNDMYKELNNDIQNQNYNKMGDFFDVYLDVLTNAYFCKLAINRIFEHIPEIIEIENINEILSFALTLDSLYSDKIYLNEEVLTCLSYVINGYQAILKYNNVKEIYELYDEMKWNDNVLNKISKINNSNS